MCYCNTPDADGFCPRCGIELCARCRRDDELCFVCRFCAECGEAYNGPARPGLTGRQPAEWTCWTCRVDKAERLVSNVIDNLILDVTDLPLEGRL